MVEVATRVLIAGGGVAALAAALAVRELGEGRVSVELLAPEPEFWCRPLAVAEPFDLGEVRHFDLAELAAAAGATFSPGALSSVDAGSRLAQTSVGSSVPYDVLLVACGAGPTPAVPGAPPCRACAGRGSTACRRRSRGSSPSTRTGRCTVLPTSSPPATSPASRSSRAESLPSRQTQPPRRSRPTPAPTLRRSPFARCCAVYS